MMVDMHCHVVYGVDDGAQTRRDMQDMLRLAAENGVGHIVCTSHISPGEERFPEETYFAHLAEGQAYADAEGLGIRLHQGTEILYTPQTARMVADGRVPTLDKKWAVLVEFWYEVPEETIRDAASRLTQLGMQVIFAHVERYKAARSLRLLREMKDEYGMLMQMNCSTVYGRLGFLDRRWRSRVLDGGLIDMVASDAHNVSSRACNMRRAYDALAEQYGRETADELCGGAIARVLGLE